MDVSIPLRGIDALRRLPPGVWRSPRDVSIPLRGTNVLRPSPQLDGGVRARNVSIPLRGINALRRDKGIDVWTEAVFQSPCGELMRCDDPARR